MNEPEKRPQDWLYNLLLDQQKTAELARKRGATEADGALPPPFQQAQPFADSFAGITEELIRAITVLQVGSGMSTPSPPPEPPKFNFTIPESATPQEVEPQVVRAPEAPYPAPFRDDTAGGGQRETSSLESFAPMPEIEREAKDPPAPPATEQDLLRPAFLKEEDLPPSFPNSLKGKQVISPEPEDPKAPMFNPAFPERKFPAFEEYAGSKDKKTETYAPVESSDVPDRMRAETEYVELTADYMRNNQATLEQVAENIRILHLRQRELEGRLEQWISGALIY